MKQGVVSPEVLMNIHVHMHKLNTEMFSHHQSQAGFKEILNEQTWMEVYVAGSWNHATLEDTESLHTHLTLPHFLFNYIFLDMLLLLQNPLNLISYFMFWIYYIKFSFSTI